MGAASASLPTRATALANPGITATIAEQPSAIRRSSNNSRPMAYTSGATSEAASALSQRRASTCAARPRPRINHSSGAMAQ